MTVLFFARARDVVGVDAIRVEPPLPRTIGELRRRLVERYPNLAGLLMKSALAVNDEYADDATPIPENAEVALLPPVSGG